MTQQLRPYVAAIALATLGAMPGRTGAQQLTVAGGPDGLARRVYAGAVSGRVVGAVSKLPMAGVTVILDGTRYGAQTTEEGNFTIANVPAGSYVARARIIGSAARTRPVTFTDGGTATIEFALEPTALRLDEVVTTAPGDQRRAAVGNSIATVAADSVMRAAPVTQLSDLLSGRAAGVQLLATSGTTGAGVRVRIRGLNSISLNNDPIIY